MKRLLQNTCLLLLAGSRVTIAQPATDNTPKAPNPRNIGGVAAKTPAEIAAEDKAILAGRADTLKRFAEIDAKQEKEYLEAFRAGQNMVRETMKMTPAQLDEWKRAIHDRSLRRELGQAGFKDLKTQDAIVAFVAAQEKSRVKVRAAAKAVYLGVEPQGAAITRANRNTRLGNYIAAAQRAKTERETATQNLDAAIGFSANPRLLARLIIEGFINESSWFTGYVLPTGALSLEALDVVR